MFTSVLAEVKGLGDGSEKGASLPNYLILKISLRVAAEIEGFFNLLFSHFLALYPLSEPGTRSQLATLLKTISASSDQTSARYRMCGICHYKSYCVCLKLISTIIDSRTSSTPSLDGPASGYLYIRPFLPSRVRTTTLTFSACPSPKSRNGSRSGRLRQRRRAASSSSL